MSTSGQKKQEVHRPTEVLKADCNEERPGEVEMEFAGNGEGEAPADSEDKVQLA